MDFNLRKAPGASGPGATLLLAAGALAVAASLSWYGVLHREIERLADKATEIRRLMHRSPVRLAETPALARELQQEVRIANTIVQQMTIPWDRLFQNLESSAGDGVALLAVQPDVRARQVRIDAEAMNLKTMLAYTRRLESSDMLGTVVLVGHEVKTQDPQRPVSFSVMAAWGKQP
jgi:Tfp pilus assembly protein PilN